MATFNPRRFANADALQHIHPANLHELLCRFAGYFTSREVDLDLLLGEEDFDYDALVGVLVSPNAATPPDLIDALHLIHEMASDDGHEQILEVLDGLPAAERDAFGDLSESTAADIAVAVWLRDPGMLERLHEEEHVLRARRSFNSYLPQRPPEGDLEPPPRSALDLVERDLKAWFQEKGKGDLVRVFAYPRSDGVWFLVRHGEAFRREPSQEGGRSVVVFYRPEAHDILLYRHDTGELRMNAGSIRAEREYRRLFGLYLFGTEDHFLLEGQKYTLDPLRLDGADSLTCTDIDGIDEIHLKEVTYLWGGTHREVEVRKAADIFAALEERDRTLPNRPLIGAKFRVKFTDSKKERSVAINPPKRAAFSRHEDSELVETWMSERGFSLASRNGDGDESRETLDGD